MSQSENLMKYFNLAEIKNEYSSLHGNKEAWLHRLENYTYTFVRQMYFSMYARIFSLRSEGVTDTSLDLELIALGLLREMFSYERVYNVEDYKKYPSLEKLDALTRAIALKTSTFNVRSVDDVIEYPLMNELLEGFMREELIINNKKSRIEIGN